MHMRDSGLQVDEPKVSISELRGDALDISSESLVHDFVTRWQYSNLLVYLEHCRPPRVRYAEQDRVTTSWRLDSRTKLPMKVLARRSNGSRSLPVRLCERVGTEISDTWCRQFAM